MSGSGDGVGEEGLDLGVSLAVTITETVHGVVEEKKVVCVLSRRAHTARHGAVGAACAEGRGA